MLSGNATYFPFVCVSHKGNHTDKGHTSALINPSLLSSLLQAAVLQLWKTPSGCSVCISGLCWARGHSPGSVIGKGKNGRCPLRAQSKGCPYIMDVCSDQGAACFKVHHGPYFRCVSRAVPQQHRSRRWSRHGKKGGEWISLAQRCLPGESAGQRASGGCARC